MEECISRLPVFLRNLRVVLCWIILDSSRATLGGDKNGFTGDSNGNGEGSGSKLGTGLGSEIAFAGSWSHSHFNTLVEV